MARAPSKNLTYHYGDSFDTLNVTWKDDAGLPFDLTGWTPHWSVRLTFADALPTLLLEQGTGLALDELGGTVSFVATPTQMMGGSLVEGVRYVQDLELRGPLGEVKTLFAGRFWVDEQVTRP